MLRILIPTDFSPNAHKAAGYALMLFGKDAEFTLINTYEVPQSGETMLITISDILEKDSMKLLFETQASLEEEFGELASEIKVVAKLGSPDSVIGKMVADEGYDLVVMGTKGASGIKGVLVGSVASNTMQMTTCPVIAIPGSADPVIPKKVLFAADDQCLKSGKFPELLEWLVQKHKAEVMVVNVIPEGENVHVGVNSETEVKPDSIFSRVNHSIHFIEDADVYHGIEKFMHENRTDMLAMVTRRDDFIGRLFGLSISKQMMLHTSIPMVVFH